MPAFAKAFHNFIRYQLSRAYHFPSRLGLFTRLRRPVNRSPLPTYNHRQVPWSSARTDFVVMSHSCATESGFSSSNFQLTINNALKAYEKQTKKDLLAHPLAPQLQACDSPGDILAVLQQQIQGLDRSRSSDERWTKWLGPTVNVLFAFSATLGSGVGLVCSSTCAYLKSSYLFGRCSLPRT